MERGDHMSDVIQHHGVKGMKWGKHKAGGGTITPDAGGAKLKVLEKAMNNTKDPVKLKALQKQYGKIEDSINYSKPKSGPNKATQASSKLKDNVKARVDSIKRQNSWKQVVKNMDNMTNAQIQKHANRIQLENDLRQLSKRKGLIKDKGVGTAADRKAYLNRAKLSDAELAVKVTRLRVKANLLRTVNDANRTQQEIGKRVVKAGATIGVKYALTGTVSLKDVAGVATNANGSYGQSKAEMIKRGTNAIPDKTILSRKPKV